MHTCIKCPLGRVESIEGVAPGYSVTREEVVSYLLYVAARNRLDITDTEKIQGTVGLRILVALEAKTRWGSKATEQDRRNMSFLDRNRNLPGLVDRCVELKQLGLCAIEEVSGDEVLSKVATNNEPRPQE